MTHIVHVYVYVRVHVGQQIQTRQRTNMASGHLYSDIYMKVLQCTLPCIYSISLFCFCTLLITIISAFSFQNNSMWFGLLQDLHDCIFKNKCTIELYNVKYKHSFWQLHGMGGTGVVARRAGLRVGWGYNCLQTNKY